MVRGGQPSCGVCVYVCRERGVSRVCDGGLVMKMEEIRRVGPGGW